MKQKLIIILLMVALLVLNSCDPETTPDINGNTDVVPVAKPAYIGTWSMEEVDDTGPQTTKIKLDIVIKNDIMESYVQVEIAEKWADAAAFKGSYIVNGDKFDFTGTHEKTIEAEKIGIESFPEEWKPIATEDRETQTITWSVEGNKITLTSPPITEGGEPTVQVLTKVAE